MNININDIDYLSFQGGGGKGLVYLGAVQALEEKLNVRSLIDINQDIYERKIKGISGASAGAITAFMLAIGMSSKQVEKEFNRVNEKMSIGFGFYSQNEAQSVSPFEKFFEDYLIDVDKKRDPNLCNKKYRIRARVYDERKNEIVDNFCHKNSTFAEGIIQDYVYNFLTSYKGKAFRLYIEKADSFLLKRIFDIPWLSITEKRKVQIPSTYIYNMLFNRGMFPGFEVRRYFSYIIDNYLFPNIIEGDVDSKDLTFKEFFNLTGTDLVITGTNTTTHRPKYFSVYHTPDFSVVDAVSLSMNLPFIFKPFYIDSVVNKSKGASYNEEYKGFWVDGGMLNNYPIHAFDKLSSISTLKYKNSSYPTFKVAASNEKISDFKNNVLGFMLTEKEEIEPEETADYEEKNLIEKILFFYKKTYTPILEYLIDQDFGPFAVLASANFAGDLLGTFMYPGSEGQIRTKEQQESTIEINTLGLSVTDFSSPAINRLRGQLKSAENKENLIKLAKKQTLRKI